MKTHPFLAAAVCLAAVSAHFPSAAVVLEDDVLITPGYGYQVLTLQKSFSSGLPEGLFQVVISPSGASNYLLSLSGIAQQYEFYEVAPGQVLDAAFRQSTTPLLSNLTGELVSTTLTFVPDEKKLLGYWDAGFASRPELYGWVELSDISGGLIATRSATATGSGIIVGTLSAVPEPANMLMFLMGIAGLVLAASRQVKVGQAVVNAA